MSALTLYDIEQDLQAYLDTEEGGIPEDLQGEFAQSLLAAGERALDKRDSSIKFFSVVDAHIAAIDAERDRLASHKKRLERGKQAFRKYLAFVLRSLPKPKKGAPKLEGRIGSISLRKGAASVEIVNDQLLPGNLVDVEVRIPAAAWFAVLDAVKDPVIGSALASARPTIHPRKDVLKPFLLDQFKQLSDCDFSMLDETEEQREMRLWNSVAEACGAKIVTGDSTVVVQ